MNDRDALTHQQLDKVGTEVLTISAINKLGLAVSELADAIMVLKGQASLSDIEKREFDEKLLHYVRWSQEYARRLEVLLERLK